VIEKILLYQSWVEDGKHGKQGQIWVVPLGINHTIGCNSGHIIKT